MTYHRHIRTTAERREEPSANEQGIVVRASRRADNLPNTYHDIVHARRGRCDRKKNKRRA